MSSALQDSKLADLKSLTANCNNIILQFTKQKSRLYLSKVRVNFVNEFFFFFAI